MPVKKKAKPAKKPAKKPVKKPARKPVKKAAKKPVAKKAGKASVKKAAKPSPKPAGKKAVEVGVITHYFPKVMAAVVKLKSPLAVGEKIRVKGHTTDFTQQVASMQLEHTVLSAAKKGQEIGLQVIFRVRRGDTVTKE